MITWSKDRPSLTLRHTKLAWLIQRRVSKTIKPYTLDQRFLRNCRENWDISLILCRTLIKSLWHDNGSSYWKWMQTVASTAHGKYQPDNMLCNASDVCNLHVWQHRVCNTGPSFRTPVLSGMLSTLVRLFSGKWQSWVSRQLTPAVVLTDTGTSATFAHDPAFPPSRPDPVSLWHLGSQSVMLLSWKCSYWA